MESLPSRVPVIQDLQKKTRVSLTRKWGNYMSNDWLPCKRSSFGVVDKYVQPEVIRTVREPIGNEDDKPEAISIQREPIKMQEEKLDSIYDVVNFPHSTEGVKVLIEGEPGIGKTSSMAFLALNWAEEKEQLKHFDLVWLIQLRFATRSSTLEDMIIAQHGALKKKAPKEEIRSILKGETNLKVLLILEGYDEYKKKTNKEIDKAVQYGLGNCYMILTSRPEDYVEKEDREKMDHQIIIKGLSKESIKTCCIQFLQSQEKGEEMLKEAKNNGVFDLLHIPILLLMVCVVYYEKKILPSSVIATIGILVQLIMDRSTLVKCGVPAKQLENLEQMLNILGEYSMESLEKDTKSLMLNRAELEKRAPDIMKLGLLIEAGAEDGDSTYVTFAHKFIQDYWGAYYKRSQITTGIYSRENVESLFPSLDYIKRQFQVVRFTIAGMVESGEDATVLIHHVFRAYVEDKDDNIGLPHFSENFMIKALRLDSRQYITAYDETAPEPIEDLRSLYVFTRMKQNVIWRVNKKETPVEVQESELPEVKESGLAKLPESSLGEVQDSAIQEIREDTRLQGQKLDKMSKIPDKQSAIENADVRAPRDVIEEASNKVIVTSNVNRPDVKKKKSCAIYIHMPDASMVENLLSVCRKISERQEITHLWIFGVKQSNISTGDECTFNLSNEAVSLFIGQSSLPSSVMCGILQQLPRCTQLQTLVINNSPSGIRHGAIQKKPLQEAVKRFEEKVADPQHRDSHLRVIKAVDKGLKGFGDRPFNFSYMNLPDDWDFPLKDPRRNKANEVNTTESAANQTAQHDTSRIQNVEDPKDVSSDVTTSKGPEQPRVKDHERIEKMGQTQNPPVLPPNLMDSASQNVVLMGNVINPFKIMENMATMLEKMDRFEQEQKSMGNQLQLKPDAFGGFLSSGMISGGGFNTKDPLLEQEVGLDVQSTSAIDKQLVDIVGAMETTLKLFTGELEPTDILTTTKADATPNPETEYSDRDSHETRRVETGSPGEGSSGTGPGSSEIGRYEKGDSTGSPRRGSMPTENVQTEKLGTEPLGTGSGGTEKGNDAGIITIPLQSQYSGELLNMEFPVEMLRTMTSLRSVGLFGIGMSQEQSTTACKQLRYLPHLEILDLSCNLMDGSLSHLIPGPGEAGLPALEAFMVTFGQLNGADMTALTHLVKRPQISFLNLMNNVLFEREEAVGKLVEAAITQRPDAQLHIQLTSNYLSEEFHEKWTAASEGTEVKLVTFENEFRDMRKLTVSKLWFFQSNDIMDPVY